MPRPSPELEAREVAEAKALFERNIQAIVSKDREAYLACYRPSPKLVRAGPTGVTLGFEKVEASTPKTGSEAWPQSLEAQDLELQWLAPGVVYGMYRYRVVIDGILSTGRSERVFIREGGRWSIAVSTAFDSY